MKTDWLIDSGLLTKLNFEKIHVSASGSCFEIGTTHITCVTSYSRLIVIIQFSFKIFNRNSSIPTIS